LKDVVLDADLKEKFPNIDETGEVPLFLVLFWTNKYDFEDLLQFRGQNHPKQLVV
jgi:hypothetical protein